MIETGMNSGADKMPELAGRSALASYIPIAEGIAALFAPFVEAVIHDLSANTIVHIANAVSPREVGDPSDLKDTVAPGAAVIGPYERTNFDGRRLKSITIVLRQGNDEPIGLLCINTDVTAFESVRRTLQLFLGDVEPTEQVKAAFHDDWHERINRFVAAWIAEHRTTVERLSKDERREIIQALHEIRGFEGHRAASYVAKMLGVSRATIYNELVRIRSKTAA
jgi:predicted transcriptional regulator YheO